MKSADVKKVINFLKSKNLKFEFYNVIKNGYSNRCFGFEYKKDIWAWFEIDLSPIKEYGTNFYFLSTYNQKKGTKSTNHKGLNTWLNKNFNCFV